MVHGLANVKLHVLWIFWVSREQIFGTATSYFCGIPLYFEEKTTAISRTPLFEIE